MNIIVPSLPLHEEVDRNVPFETGEENRFSVQIGLMPNLNRETLSWGWQLSWPLANTNPSVAFHSHLQSSPSRLPVEAAAADTGEHLCGPPRMLTAPSWFSSCLCFVRGCWEAGKEWTSLALIFPPSLWKSSETDKPFGNCSGVLWKTQIRVWAQWHLCPLKNTELNTEVPFVSVMIQQRQVNQQNRKSKKARL